MRSGRKLRRASPRNHAPNAGAPQGASSTTPSATAKIKENANESANSKVSWLIICIACKAAQRGTFDLDQASPLAGSECPYPLRFQSRFIVGRIS
jgi:hypothetical protein